MQLSDSDLFLSTPSARRATRSTEEVEEAKLISIHALREEGDVDFVAAGKSLKTHISIHALREEGDITAEDYKRITGISIHALREEGDP